MRENEKKKKLRKDEKRKIKLAVRNIKHQRAHDEHSVNNFVPYFLTFYMLQKAFAVC